MNLAQVKLPRVRVLAAPSRSHWPACLSTGRAIADKPTFGGYVVRHDRNWWRFWRLDWLKHPPTIFWRYDEVEEI